MNVFEYVIVQRPTKNQKDKGEFFGTIIVAPTAIVAKDAEQAKLRAARAIPAEFAENDCVEVFVRPFC